MLLGSPAHRGGDRGEGRGHETLIQPLAKCGAADCRKVGSRTDSALFTLVLISISRRFAPARCGAFGDGRRIVAGDGGGECGCVTRASLLGQWSSARVRVPGRVESNHKFRKAAAQIHLVFEGAKNDPSDAKLLLDILILCF
jgi:hypothetical protein